MKFSAYELSMTGWTVASLIWAIGVCAVSIAVTVMIQLVALFSSMNSVISPQIFREHSENRQFLTKGCLLVLDALCIKAIAAHKLCSRHAVQFELRWPITEVEGCRRLRAYDCCSVLNRSSSYVPTSTWRRGVRTVFKIGHGGSRTSRTALIAPSVL